MHRAVTALLGPTNTGKTYLAIERMLTHPTGMIGFPLRLLARENYDRVAALRGADAVALVTGEERIVPPKPSYWMCTVEAMPLDLRWTSSRWTRSSSPPTASAATSSPTASRARGAGSRRGSSAPRPSGRSSTSSSRTRPSPRGPACPP